MRFVANLPTNSQMSFFLCFSFFVCLHYFNCLCAYDFVFPGDRKLAAAYRMVQPNVWGVQTTGAVPAMPNNNAAQPQMMYTSMPQYQTQ